MAQKLSDFLLEQKLLTKEQLDRALAAQKEKNQPLHRVLVELGFVSEKDLLSVLSENLNIPPVDLARFELDPNVAKLIPKELAQHYEIVPISKIGKTVTIAMANPLNVFALEEIRSLTGLDLRPTIASQKDVSEAFRRLYSGSMQEAIETALEGYKPKSRLELVTTEKEREKDSEELMRMTQHAPVVQITDLILEEGCKLRASDIFIEPMENELRIRYRVDGVLKVATSPPKSMQEALVSRIKVMSHLNIAERRLPQDGRFLATIQGRDVDFRVSTVPSSYGEKAVLRVLDRSQAPLDVEKLGFRQKALEDLKKAAARPHGLIFVCGPTGSGKSTTLYSVLKFVDTPEKNIVTVEDPVEFQIEGINQVTARLDIGLTYAAALRSILRQDPDIIMVGEIRDYETVDVAIKAALTGHLVLSTLHTTTACGAVARLLNMGVEPFLITSALTLTCAQRLVRKLCKDCKKPYRLEPAVSGKLNLPVKDKKDLTLYKAVGCTQCFGTGYRGRLAILETVPITSSLRSLILQRAQESEISRKAKEEGMMTLQENALSEAVEGKTSLEEVLRVTTGT